MDISKLREHIEKYKQHLERDHSAYVADTAERQARREYYKSWTKEIILKMSQEDFEEYISKLWAMLIWGNKKYVTDKIIADHGMPARLAHERAQHREAIGHETFHIVVEEVPIDGHAPVFHVRGSGIAFGIADVGGEFQLPALKLR